MYHPQEEEANLLYLEWQDLYNREKPFQIFALVPEYALPNRSTTNLVFKEGNTEIIHDTRGMESQFTLDKQGFAFCRHTTQIKEFEQGEDVENIYLPEMEALIKREVEGVDQVYFFDWRVNIILKQTLNPKSLYLLIRHRLGRTRI